MSVVDLPPRFRIAVAERPPEIPGKHTIVLAESHAFGDGSHESTCMCVQAIAAFAPRGPFRFLDVGSGSGILSIAAAKLGGQAIGVEIDDAANAVARENARRNGVAAEFGTAWPAGVFDLVVANILRDVLLALAGDLVRRVAPGGRLVLGGLVSTDAPAIIARFGPAFDGRRPEVFERGPWRTLVWCAANLEAEPANGATR